jgi:epoxide hydrolase-like predicted phosphatase
MIKAVVFDYGGVLAELPSSGWIGCLAKMLGMSEDELSPHWNKAVTAGFSTGKLDETAFWQILEDSLGKQLPDNKQQIWIEGSALEPVPEMLEIAKRLRQSGLQTAILSNTVEPFSRLLHKINVFVDDFSPAIFSHEVGLAKPDKAIYQLMLDRINLRAEECVFIDDLPHNVAAARELGMTGLDFESIGKLKADLKKVLL